VNPVAEHREPDALEIASEALTSAVALSLIALYRRAGFTEVSAYGEYASSPGTSVCLAKEL